MSPNIKPNKTVKHPKNNPNVVYSKKHLRSWVRMPKRVQNYVIEQVSLGRTCVSLAKELKMSNMGIHCFLKRRGLKVSDLRKANRGKDAEAIALKSTTMPVENPLGPKSEYAINLTPKGKSIVRMLAFYLNVSQEEVVDAALVKYDELQKSIVRDMLAKG
mgnify:CR=1 FL=1